MDTHKNARLTPKGREEMVRAVVDGGLSKAAAARKYNTTSKTVAKWVGRFRADGLDGLRDRSSKPLSSPSQIGLATADAVEKLRRQRHTQEHLAAELGISKASVPRILKRRGPSRLSASDRRNHARATNATSRARSSISTLRNLAASTASARVARADIFPDQKKEIAVAFLIATIAYFKSLGVTVERVMTDNGNCYLSKAFARACKQFGVKHVGIKPYTPQTNGKAERFIQTALREWAYATAFEHSQQRYSQLPTWLHRYNWHRPHASLTRKASISRLGLTGNNLLRH